MPFQAVDVSFGGLVVDGLGSSLTTDRIPEDRYWPKQKVENAKAIRAAIKRTTTGQDAKCGAQTWALFFDGEVVGPVSGKFRFLRAVQTRGASSGQCDECGCGQIAKRRHLKLLDNTIHYGYRPYRPVDGAACYSRSLKYLKKIVFLSSHPIQHRPSLDLMLDDRRDMQADQER